MSIHSLPTNKHIIDNMSHILMNIACRATVRLGSHTKRDIYHSGFVHIFELISDTHHISCSRLDDAAA